MINLFGIFIYKTANEQRQETIQELLHNLDTALEHLTDIETKLSNSTGPHSPVHKAIEGIRLAVGRTKLSGNKLQCSIQLHEDYTYVMGLLGDVNAYMAGTPGLPDSFINCIKVPVSNINSNGNITINLF